jgi:hypothetical protein
MEMVYRGLYHFVYAYQDGEYTNPVQFLADEAKLLGRDHGLYPTRSTSG